MKNRKRIISLLVTAMMLFTVVPGQFSSTMARGLVDFIGHLLDGFEAQGGGFESQAGEYPDANVSVKRRAVPTIELDVPPVVRVAKYHNSYEIADATTGGVIVSATPSGSPAVTSGLADISYAEETPDFPIINLRVKKDPNYSAQIISINVEKSTTNGTPGSISFQTLNKDLNAGTASWKVGVDNNSGLPSSGGIRVGRDFPIEYVFTVVYKWRNTWARIWVTDTFQFRGFSYAENIIYPAGVWFWTNTRTADDDNGDLEKCDIRMALRVLGRNTYGKPLGDTGATHGYLNFALSTLSTTTNSFADTNAAGVVPRSGTNGNDLTSTMFFYKPSGTKWYKNLPTDPDGHTSNNNRGHIWVGGTALDENRAKAIVYMDSKAENLTTLGLRMAIFNNAFGRSPAIHGGKTAYYRGTYVQGADYVWNNGTTTASSTLANEVGVGMGVGSYNMGQQARDLAGGDADMSKYNGFDPYDSGRGESGFFNSYPTRNCDVDVTQKRVDTSPHLMYINNSVAKFNELKWDSSDGKVYKSTMGGNEKPHTQYIQRMYGTSAGGNYTLIPYFSAYYSFYPNHFWQADSIAQNQTMVGLGLQINAYDKSELYSQVADADVVAIPKLDNSTGTYKTIYEYPQGNGIDPDNYLKLSTGGRGRLPQTWYYESGYGPYLTQLREVMKELRYVPTTQGSINVMLGTLELPKSGLSLRPAKKDATYLVKNGGIYTTYTGSDVEAADDYYDATPLRTLKNLLDAVNLTSGSYLITYDGTANVNILADWHDPVKRDTYYTPETANVLKHAYSNALKVYNDEISILYQPTIDFATRELQDAIENLRYELLDLNEGNLLHDKLLDEGYMAKVGIYNPFAIPPAERVNLAHTAYAAKDNIAFNPGYNSAMGWDEDYVYTKEARENIQAATKRWEGFISPPPDYRQKAAYDNLINEMKNLVNAEPTVSLGGEKGNQAWTSMYSLLYGSSTNVYALATEQQRQGMNEWLDQIKKLVGGVGQPGFVGDNLMGPGGSKQKEFNGLIDELFRYLYYTMADFTAVDNAVAIAEKELAKTVQAIDPQGIGANIPVLYYAQATIDNYKNVRDLILPGKGNIPLAEVQKVSLYPAQIENSYTGSNAQIAGANLYYLWQVTQLPQDCPADHFPTDTWNAYNSALTTALNRITQAQVNANWIATGSNAYVKANYQEGSVNTYINGLAANLYAAWKALDGGFDVDGETLLHTGHKNITVQFYYNDATLVAAAGSEFYEILLTDDELDTYTGHGDLGDGDFGLYLDVADPPNPPGKKFAGWYSTPALVGGEETGTKYKMPIKYPTTGGTVVRYYARWEDLGLIMTFLPGDDAPSGFTYPPDGPPYTIKLVAAEMMEFKASTIKFSHPQWSVVSWTGSDGKTYKTGDVVKFEEDMVFTANWALQMVTITYWEAEYGTLLIKSVPKGSQYVRLTPGEIKDILDKLKAFDEDESNHVGHQVTPAGDWESLCFIDGNPITVSSNLPIQIMYEPTLCEQPVIIRKHMLVDGVVKQELIEVKTFLLPFDTFIAKPNQSEFEEYIKNEIIPVWAPGYLCASGTYNANYGPNVTGGSWSNLTPYYVSFDNLAITCTLVPPIVNVYFYDSPEATTQSSTFASIRGCYEYSTASWAEFFAGYVAKAAENGMQLVSADGVNTNKLPDTFPVSDMRYNLVPLPEGDKYLVTVAPSGGTGGGNYAAGVTVSISAAAPESGMRFKEWVANPAVAFTGGTNATDASAKFIMPAQTVVMTASYEVIPPTTYLVTVLPSGGTGGGNYAAGMTVSISAAAPESGMRFKEWIAAPAVAFSGGTGATDASAKFTMPASAVTLTATYEEIPPTTYLVTVNGGTGGGNYAAGVTVSISAAAPESGKQFKEWVASPAVAFTGGTGAADASAKFTMPASAVTLTATYENIPTYPIVITGGSADGSAYVEGDVVTITASATPAGKWFSKWVTTPNVEFVDDTNAEDSTAKFKMPKEPTTITALYAYTFTVNSGSGDGKYEAGTDVPIVADPAPAGKVFDKWVVTGSGVLANAYSASTTFKTAEGVATVTATYKDATVSTKARLISKDKIVIVDDYLHYIYGFGPGVTWTAMFKNHLAIEGDGDAVPATQGETYIGTGFQLRFYPERGETDYIVYTFVLFGDTGDGWVNASDAAECLNLIGKRPTEMTPQVFAMAFNNDSDYYVAPTADTRTIISNYAKGNAYIDFGDYAAMRYRVVETWFKSH